jgi:hypothetical protein
MSSFVVLRVSRASASQPMKLHIITAKTPSSALASILLSIASRLVRRCFFVRQVVQTSPQETVEIDPRSSYATTTQPRGDDATRTTIS